VSGPVLVLFDLDITVLLCVYRCRYAHQIEDTSIEFNCYILVFPPSNTSNLKRSSGSEIHFNGILSRGAPCSVMHSRSVSSVRIFGLVVDL
jgi:hypothetical protein